LTWIKDGADGLPHCCGGSARRPFARAAETGAAMTQTSAPAKGMTLGEIGLVIVFTLLAFLSIFIAAEAYEPAFAFHATLFALAGAAAAIAIVNRYLARPAQAPPQTIAIHRDCSPSPRLLALPDAALFAAAVAGAPCGAFRR
jgi:hypothetical protein